MSIQVTVKIDLFCDQCGWQEIVATEALAREEQYFHTLACPARKG